MANIRKLGDGDYHGLWRSHKGLRVLGGSAARATLLAGMLLLGVATLAGMVRLLPWLVAPGVPYRAVLPFARGLLAMGLETSLLAAPPLGWAYACSVLVERGEARALFCLGVSPGALVRTTLGPAVLFAALAGAAGLVWGIEAAAPGRLARDLVAQSKQSCQTVTSPRALDVPVVGVTWLCSPNVPPRLAGSLPGTGRGTFTAADLVISDDLRAIELTDLRIAFGDAATMRVHARGASVAGLAPWGRASNLRPWLRAGLLAATGSGIALLAALFVLRGGHSSRIAALGIGAAGPVTALLLFSILERRTSTPALYFAVPAAAAAAVIATSWLAGVLGRSSLRWRSAI